MNSGTQQGLRCRCHPPPASQEKRSLFLPPWTYVKHCPTMGVMTRTCPACHATKPLTEYYGGKGYCRPCCYAKSRDWHQSHKERKADINRAWRKRNHDRRQLLNGVTNALHSAIRAGKLERGTECATCGSTSAIEAAHFDYDQPLNVLWLCRPCHRQWDAIRAKSV